METATAATMETATAATMETAPATTMEAAAYPWTSSSPEPSSVAAANITPVESITWPRTTPSAVIPVSTAPVPAAPSPRPSPSPSIPGPDTDEETACKPLRPVVAVRSAGVGVIGVVAPVTYWRPVLHRRGNHRRSDSNAHSHLGVRLQSEGDHQKRCDQCKAKTAHNVLPVLPCPAFPGHGRRRS